MTELRCLITVSILAGSYFRSFSSLWKNGFFSQGKIFLRNPSKKSVHAPVRVRRTSSQELSPSAPLP